MGGANDFVRVTSDHIRAMSRSESSVFVHSVVSRSARSSARTRLSLEEFSLLFGASSALPSSLSSLEERKETAGVAAGALVGDLPSHQLRAVLSMVGLLRPDFSRHHLRWLRLRPGTQYSRSWVLDARAGDVPGETLFFFLSLDRRILQQNSLAQHWARDWRRRICDRRKVHAGIARLLRISRAVRRRSV